MNLTQMLWENMLGFLSSEQQRTMALFYDCDSKLFGSQKLAEPKTKTMKVESGCDGA